jgi:hypothetical protein
MTTVKHAPPPSENAGDAVRICLRLSAAMLAVISISCSAGTPFTVTASYQPRSGEYRQIEIHAYGVRPAGADLSEASNVRLTASSMSGRQTIVQLVTRQFDLYIAEDATATLKSGTPFDRNSAVQLLIAIGANPNNSDLPTQAQELINIAAAAALGPKAGLPETTELILLKSSSGYP